MKTNPRDIKAAFDMYLPNYYRDLYEAQAITDAQTVAVEQLIADIDDVLAQFNVTTATWGLAKWESLLGLDTEEPNATWNELTDSFATFADISKTRWEDLGNGTEPSRQERRSKIISRLRGVGTVTPAMIKSVAESYSNGDVGIIVDHAKYTVTVRFIGELGIPVALDDIKRMLREIIPAHLAIKYEYTYMNFDQLTSYGFTFDSLTAKGLTFERLGSYSQ